MRDRARLEFKPGRWQDQQRAERKRHLSAVLAMLRRARENQEPWYVWVLEHRARRLEGRSRPLADASQSELDL